MQQSLKLAAVMISALLLASCTAQPLTDAKTPKEKRDERLKPQGSLLTGQSASGFRLDEVFTSPQGGGSALPVNALLWRASLDTLSVMPLGSVDTFGGTIISEWYAHPDIPSQRIKVAVFVVDQELRSDAIRVEVYVQQRPDGMFEWIDAGRDEELATRLEDLILTRAREIRSSGVSETN